MIEHSTPISIFSAGRAEQNCHHIFNSITRILESFSVIVLISSKRAEISINTMSAPFRLLWDKYHPPAPPQADFSGKTVLVTGANIGLGLETVAHYVRLNASSVILTSRNVDNGERAKAEIEARYSRQGVISVWQLDMSRFANVESFAKRVEAELPRLDMAVLNAGVHTAKYTKSPEGWEETLQVNTLSTSLLAILLLPKLEKAKSSTSMPHMHIVGSTMHRAVLPTDIYEQPDLLQKFSGSEGFNPFKSYAVSKLFMLYIVRELAARNTSQGKEPSVVIDCSCPGSVGTQLGRDFDNFFFRIVKYVMFTFFARTSEEGSRTYINATLQGVEGHGEFYKNDQIQK